MYTCTFSKALASMYPRPCFQAFYTSPVIDCLSMKQRQTWESVEQMISQSLDATADDSSHTTIYYEAREPNQVLEKR